MKNKGDFSKWIDDYDLDEANMDDELRRKKRTETSRTEKKKKTYRNRDQKRRLAESANAFRED